MIRLFRRLHTSLRCRFLIVTALLLFAGSWTTAAEYRTTCDFHDVEKVIANYVEKYGAEHVLLSIDIDNTLLAMNQDLGSDQWFEWQAYLLEEEPKSSCLVANSFDQLVEVQALLFALGRMHPPQAEQPAIIRRIQDQGIATLVLTSRSHEVSAATERELKRSGYELDKSALPVRDRLPEPFLPYDPENPEATGLTTEELEIFNLQTPKPVYYVNGIMMLAGQHKGAMLLTMLHRSPREIKAVVFVDDHGRHVGNVFAALAGRGIEVTTYHFQHEDARVKRFQYGSKEHVTQQWGRLKTTLDTVFPAGDQIEQAELATPVH